jgi:hypothetical protein
LLVISMIFAMHRPRVNPVAIAYQPPVDVRAIDAEIQEHTRVAELLMSDQRLQLAEAKLDELQRAPGSEMWLQDQREQAATTLLRSTALMTDRHDIAGVCREVATLFPDAAAATVADARLAEIH